MCLAIPGKILSVEKNKALVQYPQEQRTVLVGGDPVEPGDYVMVQMGVVVRIISPEEAKLSLRAWGKN